MINPLIIENKKDSHLKKAISKFGTKAHYLSVDYTELLGTLVKHESQLIFLKIDSSGNVFKTISQLDELHYDGSIVLISSDEKYALRAIQFNFIFDYLLLPISDTDLKRIINKYERRLQRKKNPSQKIPFPNSVKVSYIQPNKILYCKSDGNYSWIIDSSEKIHSNYKLKQIEENLDNKQFLRIHKQFIVNLSKIKEYHKKEGGYIIMDNNDKIPISRTKKDLLLSKIRLG